MAEAKINKLLKKRERIKERVIDYDTYVTNAKAAINPNDVHTRVEILQFKERLDNVLPLLREFNAIEEQVEDLSSEDMSDATFEDFYYAAVAKAKALYEIMTHESLVNKKETQNATEIALASDIQLPTISLPKFNGEITRWLEFKDCFETIVNKNLKLTKIQKLYYLRSALSDDAAQIISALDSTSESYDLAWTLVCDRYENKRMLIQSHIKALLNFKFIKGESFHLFREMSDKISIHLRALETLGEKVEHWDSILIVTLTAKFNEITAREWEVHTKTFKDFPKIANLQQFLKERAIMLENIQFNKSDDISTVKINSTRTRTLLTSNAVCYYCKKNHSIYTCVDFKSLTPENRIKYAREHYLCLNCLRSGHSNYNCQSFGCRKCKHKHNSLLHIEKSNASTTKNNAAISKSISCLLPTAVVCICDNQKSFCSRARALLDSGSQSSFITEEMANKLKLNIEEINMRVEGINSSVSNIKGRSCIYIKSGYSGFTTQLSVLVVPEITSNLPQKELDISNLNIPSGLQLADPEFFVPSKINLLLGAGVFFEILLQNKITTLNFNCFLHETKFGWIVAGFLPNIFTNFAKTVSFLSKNKDIERQLERFWQIEECQAQPGSNSCNSFAETHFCDNYQRQSDGRFVVSIPFNKNLNLLGDSRDSAKRQFFSLERRLNSNLHLRNLYHGFMREYIGLGHMTKIGFDDTCKHKYFLPHHGVLRESSVTTKLRVVFNGSNQTTTGLALNNLQAVGPVIQKDIFSILIRFRRHLIAVCADIVKMYRQILVNKNDRPMQRIFWRQSTDDKVDVYELNTVTYGTASASFLAIRCLHQLALDNAEKYPYAANVIANDFYVNDLITGADNILQVKTLIGDIINILNSGCLPLSKWSSNCSEMINILENSENNIILNLGEYENTKTLGMFWDTQTDEFVFKVGEVFTEMITKRAVLSMTGQIYDPLGILGPAIVIAKLFLQALWQENLGWDDPLSESVCASWVKFRNEFKGLDNLRIPRCIKVSSHNTCIQLHGFSDASGKAYGACVYLLFESAEGVTVRLLASKSRVAPLKSQTIPRLELCGAYLLASLVNNIKNSIEIDINETYLWTDSLDVIYWLKMSPHLLKIFVGNRVARIQELTKIEDWRHIRSADNPADLLSRGVHPAQLANCKMWWSGPEFLTLGSNVWPKVPELLKNYQSDYANNEIKQAVKVFTSCDTEIKIIDRFSSLIRAKRVIAYCMRFVTNCRLPKGERVCGSLNVPELNEALIKLIKLEQMHYYSDEFKLLLKNKKLMSHSSLISLNPFIDSDQVLRVGGRLKFANLSSDQKHPIILPPKSKISILLLTYEHLRLFHAGPQQTLSSLRDKYWPIHGLVLIKKIIRKCVVCFKVKPYNQIPIMSDLPRDRVVQSYPFQVTGTDYAGPFSIKRHGGRGAKVVKAYLSLFVCFSTKACHIELVSDLSTSAFLAALKRFIARRGKPCRIWSDNATNYCGASNELKKIVKNLHANKNVIEDELPLESIKWSFIPANAPYFGGIWEAGIKQAKYYLKRIIGNALLTFEEFYTFTCQVEAIMNSRPLHPLSNDPNDLEALTPAYFLIGRKLTCLPEPDVSAVPENRLSRFVFVQRMIQHFWARWRNYYLPELQKRQKWRSSGATTLKVGDLVLIEDRTQPPLCWPLGRIAKIHPGLDGEVRVATVKTRSSTLTRPAAKLYPLPHCSS